MPKDDFSWFDDGSVTDISLEDAARKSRRWRIPRLFGRRKIKTKPFVLMVKQMAAMMNAGLPIIDVLDILAEEGHDTGRIAGEWREGIMSGKKLAESIRSSSVRIPEEFAAIVEAGEESGALVRTLRVYMTELERQDKIGKKMKSALIYPSIVLGVVGIILVVMFGFALPRMEMVFTESGAVMSGGLIGAVFGLSHLILFLGFERCLVAAAIFAAIMVFTPYGRKIILAAFSAVPAIRRLDHSSRWAMFLSVVGTSLSAGLSLPDALTLSKNVVPREFKRKFKSIIDSVYQGKEIIDPEVAKWPPVARGFIRSGLKSGNLADSFISVGRYYSEQAEELADNLSKTLEPVILIFLVAAVAPVPIVMVKIMAAMYMQMLAIK